MVANPARAWMLASAVASFALALAFAFAGAPAWAEPPPAPQTDDAKLPLEQRPYYYDRVLDDGFFQNSSAAFMRLLRNTIYAKAGRTFKDPTLRAYFEAQPWYRPRPEGSAKLSAVDEANLQAIKRSGKSPDWRAAAPLALSGYELGMEGSVSARVELVRLEDRKWGLAVRTWTSADRENDRGSEDVRRYTLKNGKLAQIGRPTRH